VKDFLARAFTRVGLNWEDFVEFDPRYLRPSEVDLLIGDAGKAKQKLGWSPKTSFGELVNIMVDSDLEAEQQLHRIVQ
jgi:GDPmannose 4,6-dehydratase